MAKVLIIEDEKAMSDLIAIKFKVEGFEVDQAFSLAEAKQKLTAGGYDAILADYLLPDGNFLDLFAEVHTDPNIAKIPIVLATNYVEDLSKDKAKELGIKEVIVKYQVVPAQMVDKIKLLVQGGSVAAPVPPPPPQPATPQPVAPVATTAPPQAGQFQATPPGVAPAPVDPSKPQSN